MMLDPQWVLRKSLMWILCCYVLIYYQLAKPSLFPYHGSLMLSCPFLTIHSHSPFLLLTVNVGVVDSIWSAPQACVCSDWSSRWFYFWRFCKLGSEALDGKCSSVGAGHWKCIISGHFPGISVGRELVCSTVLFLPWTTESSETGSQKPFPPLSCFHQELWSQWWGK